MRDVIYQLSPLSDNTLFKFQWNNISFLVQGQARIFLGAKEYTNFLFLEISENLCS